MASSLELNKVIAGILTAGIIASGSGIIAGMLYSPHEPETHAFSVTPEEPTTETAEAEAEVPFETLLAEADPAAGEGLTRQCAACHDFEKGGPNKVGPHLWDVVGRDVASVADFNYSDALKQVDGDWTFDKLNAFLKAPREDVPGTAMSFAGIKDDKKRADLIAYLDTLSDNPVPLPTAAAAEAPAEEPAAEAAGGGESEQAAAGTGQPEQAAEAAPAEEQAETASGEQAAAEAAPAEGTTEAAPAGEAAGTASGEQAPAEVASNEDASAEGTKTEEAASAGGDAAAGSSEGDGAASGGGADPFLAKVEAADPAAGKKLFRQCAACHSPDEGGGNRVGPALWGVYGRDVGTAEGFNYSQALLDIPGSWDVEKLNHYLENPKEFAPGNKMVFAGVRKEDDRAALIAYLHSLSNSPVPLEGQ